MWRAFTGICTVYLTRVRTYKIALLPQTKTQEESGPQTDKHLPPNPFYRTIFQKRRPLGFGVFLAIWSMNRTLSIEGLEHSHEKKEPKKRVYSVSS